LVVAIFFASKAWVSLALAKNASIMARERMVWPMFYLCQGETQANLLEFTMGCLLLETD
jgi:hypothetical protein